MQMGCPTSLWELYRALITLRHDYRSLAAGAITDVVSDASILTYKRILGDECMAVALNFGSVPRKVYTGDGTILLSTFADRIHEEAPRGRWTCGAVKG